jgi:hypothetical protein
VLPKSGRNPNSPETADLYREGSGENSEAVKVIRSNGLLENWIWGGRAEAAVNEVLKEILLTQDGQID